MAMVLDIDTLAAVLSHLDAQGVCQAACVSRLWKTTVSADPVVQSPIKALATELQWRQVDVAHSIGRLKERPGHFGFCEASGQVLKRSFSGRDLVTLEKERKATEQRLSPMLSWLLKRKRCGKMSEINASFDVVDIS